MKLLLPIFASLMLQPQVHTDFFGLRKCVMGFGKCKEHCAVDEKEIDACQKRKCCLGPRVIEILKAFIQSEVHETLEKNPQAPLKAPEVYNAVQLTKHHMLSLLPQIINAVPSTNPNSLIITDTPPVRTLAPSAAASPERDVEKRRGAALAPEASAAPPPP
ncbi:beta-defensin 129 [Echinops telfairi]|uniref:Beta-defensin 129 n=1 Tax=Echinops telfairi TaxID=9371 RepID=A0ABM0IEK4_ECHTE|nr:beta-defensin 129 [Echinops telfairi]